MKKIKKIRLDSFEEVSPVVDVTGGMESKVKQMLELVDQMSVHLIQIFSGNEAGNLTRALMGETIGTIISA